MALIQFNINCLGQGWFVLWEEAVLGGSLGVYQTAEEPSGWMEGEMEAGMWDSAEGLCRCLGWHRLMGATSISREMGLGGNWGCWDGVRQAGTVCALTSGNSLKSNPGHSLSPPVPPKSQQGNHKAPQLWPRVMDHHWLLFPSPGNRTGFLPQNIIPSSSMSSPCWHMAAIAVQDPWKIHQPTMVSMHHPLGAGGKDLRAGGGGP